MRSSDHFVGHAPCLFTHFIVAAAHKPLDGIHGVFGIRYRLTFCHLADQALACLCNRHYGRGRPRPLLVGDHHCFSALHHAPSHLCLSHATSHNLSHSSPSSSTLLAF